MAKTGIHIPVREDWLKRTDEEALEPELPIIDPHHHLWDRPESTYLYPELRADIGDGHRIVATVFIQCRSMYRASGPEPFRPIGEIEFVNGVAAQAASGIYGDCMACAGIVGYVDITRGAAAAPVLEAAIRAGGGRLKGLRIPVAWHAHPAVISSPAQPPQGLMASEGFRAGVARLAGHGLTLDIWAYHSQLRELVDLAKAIPQTTVIVDHCGGPIGTGPYAGRRDDVFADWAQSIAALAELPNVAMKIGGLGMRVGGFAFDERPDPPCSQELAQAWKPYFETLIAAFGPERCMFESNFPVDKGMFRYRTFWNACKRLSAGMACTERSALFSGTATRIYGLAPRENP